MNHKVHTPNMCPECMGDNHVAGRVCKLCTAEQTGNPPKLEVTDFYMCVSNGNDYTLRHQIDLLKKMQEALQTALIEIMGLAMTKGLSRFKVPGIGPTNTHYLSGRDTWHYMELVVHTPRELRAALAQAMAGSEFCTIELSESFMSKYVTKC
jgi:hypothetical protein